METAGIDPKVRFNLVPHGAQMRIHERFRMVAPTILQDRITVEDSELKSPKIDCKPARRDDLPSEIRADILTERARSVHK